MAPKKKAAAASTTTTAKSKSTTTRAKRVEPDSEAKPRSTRTKKSVADEPSTGKCARLLSLNQLLIAFKEVPEPLKKRGRPAKESAPEPSTETKPKSTRGKSKNAEPGMSLCDGLAI
jgi:hypothetical protein